MAGLTYYNLKPEGINTGGTALPAIIYVRPRVNLKTKRITGAETLLRAPEDSAQSPNCGYDENFDLATLEELFKIMAGRHAESRCKITTSVHISGQNLADAAFAKELIALKKSFGLPHGAIEIELKGDYLKFSRDYEEHSINMLRKYGFNFSMHNFGEGVSLIDLLRRYPLDLIKFRLDMFGHSLPLEKERTMITHIVRMSHTLDIPVLCEGIESLEHAMCAELTESDMGTGEYLAAAVPAAQYYNTYG